MHQRIINESILRDGLSNFEKYKYKNWYCPIIKCHCTMDCYSFEPKSFKVLEKRKNNHHDAWSPTFKTVEDFNNYLQRHNFEIEEIKSFMIHDPHCKLIEAVMIISEEIQCRNV